ncbi:ribokinase [Aphanothece sacrum]|uniref:Ribokinase n=1 Tax=Aphanothece sacrum FPU1 TaxID=1920663 RepID=A0A401IGE8_APHSA|nr:ribokinase [Aphanothece sacrum]GBF80289.1 ribokinase [Aphanothece sacrum FPU1]GBF83695.1 ribokinase [Aphanothece sacrum FPU3]
MSIIVVGSINMDLVAQTAYLPKAGETIIGQIFFTVPGGKGANQAVAAAKLGANTYLVGCVGKDQFGVELLGNLKELGVNIDGVNIEDNISSGIAIITVDNRGENTIIVIPGANNNINESDVKKLDYLLVNSKILLLQLEIPLLTVQNAAKVAKQAGITVILDPAPAPDNLPDDLYPLIDIITPNETEAQKLVGFAINTQETTQKAAQFFLERGVKSVIIKLGERGAFYATIEESFMIPPYPVNAIDTVAAGDAFNGAIAAALEQGLSLKNALKWGVIAGALTTTKIGSQSALPDLVTLEQHLKLIDNG